MYVTVTQTTDAVKRCVCIAACPLILLKN